MQEFQVGDRVKAIGKVDRVDLAGMTGTIVCVDDVVPLHIGVEFDYEIPGGEGHDCLGNGKNGYCRWGEPEDFRLLDEAGYMQTSFNLDDYKGSYVMHCATEEEANSFLEVLHNAGREWNSGDSYLNTNYYNDYGNQTCYRFNAGEYGFLQYYKGNGYIVLEWSDFMEDKTPEISDEEFHNMLSNLLQIK